MREYLVVFEEGSDGWILARAPELPGAISQGRTMAEAREMIRDAIELLVDCCREEAKAGGATWEMVATDV